MKNCPKCNAPNANTASTCKHCGADLNAKPEVEQAVLAEEKPTYHIGLAFLFLAISFIGSAVKMLFSLDINSIAFKMSNYTVYFICVAIGVIFLIPGLYCMRGLFKKKPLPGKAIFLIMFASMCIILIFLDLISLPGVISEYKENGRLVEEGYLETRIITDDEADISVLGY